MLTPCTGLGRELPLAGAVAYYIASAHTDALPKWATWCEGQKLWLAGAVWDPGCISEESGFRAHV